MFKLLTYPQIRKLYPGFIGIEKSRETKEITAEEATNQLYAIMNKFEIDSKNRQLFFLAQCAHETRGFQAYEEKFNYSFQRLLVVFKNKFTVDEAKEYAMKPQNIANRVYANRMGNGDEATGDGYNFRGRGMLQTTGKTNYSQLTSKDLSANYFKNPDLLLSFTGALESACHFWKQNNLNGSADSYRLDLNTKSINGSLDTYHERQVQAARILQQVG